MSTGISVPFVDLRAQYRSIAPEVGQAIQGVLNRADFILGEEVERFEAEFAAFVGAEHAVGVGSGLAALELALHAYGIGPGDEVITPANTFIATVLAILGVGARPVLVDVNPATYNIEPAGVAAAITPRTRVLMPVHLYGQTADMDSLLALADRHNLLVIEDAAQAHGALFRGRRAGTLGHAGAFSFYPGKNLGAYGDGGLIVTRDAEIAARLRQLRNYGQSVKYHHVVAGTNSRLDTLQAAVLRVKLRHLGDWNRARQEHAAEYDRLLGGLDVGTPAVTDRAGHVYHLYVIRVTRRDALQAELSSNGIQTGIHYPIPIHLQPACAHMGYPRGAFPETERAAGEILSLPMYPELDREKIERVATLCGEALRKSPAAD